MSETGLFVGAALLVAGTLSCRREEQRPEPATALPPLSHPLTARMIERRGTGRVSYRGLDLNPKGPRKAGEVVTLRHALEVESPLVGDYAVLVELRTPGQVEPLATDAHRPLGGRLATDRWRQKELWIDEHSLRIPARAPGPTLELFVALTENGQRMTVEAAPGASDGRDYLRLGTISIEGTSSPEVSDLPAVTVPRAQKPVAADGVADEADWAKAPVLTFSDSMGREVPTRFPTKLRLLWDDENLYAVFEAEDTDISCPFANRDDPIYDHEAVELFLMPNVAAPGLGPYVELQASPKGVIFDAAFVARRQGMDKSFDAQQMIGTQRDGTLNDPSDRDRGWVSEWAVPWKSVRGVSTAPKVNDEWRLNAFRIEKWREGGRENGEYTAWSPPRVGDFHNVERFGRLRFGP